MDLLLFQQLGMALLLASLIGLERERKYQMFNYRGFGGVRTFALIGVLGALAYVLDAGMTGLFPVVTAGFLLLVIVSYFVVAKNFDRTGATSEMAAMITYLVGVLCVRNDFVLATSIALAVVLILHFKDSLHFVAKSLKSEEVISAVEFMIIAFVILPLLPNKDYGLYGFFNPYVVWMMVVLIFGISFVSYLAIKFFGAKKGILATGFLGGLVSSTALTLSFSNESKKNKSIISPFVIAVVVACSAMFFRMLVEIFVVNQALFWKLIVPLALMGVCGFISTLVIFFKENKSSESEKVEKNVEKLKSPFSLAPALKFGILFAAVLFVSKFASVEFGDRGLYLTSLFSGMVDVDAITVSIANMTRNELSLNTAAYAITLAAIMNTLVKGAIFMIVGNRLAAKKIVLIFVFMLIVGGFSLFLI